MKMKKVKSGFVVLVVLVFIWMMMMMSGGKAEAKANNNIEEKSLPPPPAPKYYWYWEELLRKVVNRACTYLFPPKIDFRPGKPLELELEHNANANGNLKEALAKTFGTTKQILDDSAKAAAQTLQQQSPSPPDSEL